jgi:RNA polymerase sigma-70 factor (ECF subfamily)
MTDSLERAWREERVRVLATLARRLGDLQLAEDAVQEAFAAAVVAWPRTGVPDRPGAWLTTTAWRKALDVLRREGRTPEVPAPTVAEQDAGDLPVTDDLLRLVLTCCHPALALEARVALTLRCVVGLTTREIAAAFLVPEPTMAKRLVRAKNKIRQAAISFELPDRAALGQRVAGVQAVVYLVFNEGYLASGDGPPVRAELCDEALWLARQLHALLPGDPETAGLLALLLLQHARTPARQDGDGRLVPLDAQDRGRWDQQAIAEARALLAVARTAAQLGPYQVQAAIAALHAEERTNWGQVAVLYGLLARLAPSPIVEVNRAVAVGRAHGPRAGLAVLEPALVGAQLDGYAPAHAARADLLAQAGEQAAARAAWARAAQAADNPDLRAELLRRATVPVPPSSDRS